MLAAALLVVLVAALLVPVLLELQLRGDLDSGFTASLRWRVFGVIVFTRVLRRPRQRRHDAPAPGSDSERDAPASTANARAMPPAGAEQPARNRVRQIWSRLELAQRALSSGAVHIEGRPRGRVEFGLADVADTGRLYGFACAIAALADPDGALAIEPLWRAEDWLAVDVTLQARIHPLPLAMVVLRARRARRRSRDGATAEPELHPHAV